MAAYWRYAVYHMAEGALARFGAQWLGWDAAAGRVVPQPDVSGFDLGAATLVPRRYGFHATLVAPFRLGEGVSPDTVLQALGTFCAKAAPVRLARGLTLARPAGFLALVPAGQSAALSRLESQLVEAMNPLRAPLSEAEIARRRPERLSPAQRRNLDRWGYPFVRDEFRFHMTLTDSLEPAIAARAEAALRSMLPEIPDPYPINRISLMGEDETGFFREIRRFSLSESAGADPGD